MQIYNLLTSESVTEGHPDKLCDRISDALLDAYLSQDPHAHVALETLVSNNIVFVAGEVSSTVMVDIVKKVRQTILLTGYDTKEKGLDGNSCLVLTNIGEQSPDIALGVDRENGRTGAGDQGMVYGYACDETEEYMPLSISLAHRLTQRLTTVRKEKILPYLYPDGKSQVTVAYNKDGSIVGISDIVISAQHSSLVSLGQIQKDITDCVINHVIEKKLVLPDMKIHINPTGRFVVGGPAGDTGLTGRKIIVDTYGGIAHHGGGAFSGKDPTKVDRSAAYMARYAAKNIVAAGLSKKCEVGLSYAIGVSDPVSIAIDTFHTEEIPKEIIEQIIKEVFDFSVTGIIKTLSLTSVLYEPLASYGHFGRQDLDLPWERLDKVLLLQQKAVESLANLISGSIGHSH